MQVATLEMAVDSTRVRSAKKDTDELTKSCFSLADAVKASMAAFGVFRVGDMLLEQANKIKSMAREAVMNAMRYETLGVVMSVVGKNVRHTSEEMRGFTTQLEKTGISMMESRQSLTRMAQANIDLANSTKLARIAQDAAVIGNINSSESFNRLVYGIQSAQTEVLRTIGINVQFEQAYNKMAMSLGKAISKLTEQERTQARVNAVLERGKLIQGAYEASMETLGKQMKSAERYVENLSVSYGMMLEPVAKLVLTPFVKWLKESSEAMQKFVESAEGQRVIRDIVSPLQGLVTVVTDVVGWLGRMSTAMGGVRTVLVAVAAYLYLTYVPGFLAAGSAMLGAGTSAIYAQYTMANLAASLAAGQVASVGMTLKLMAQTAVTTALTAATGALSGAVAFLASGMGVLTVALAAVGTAIYFYNQETREMEERTEAAAKRHREVVTPLEEQAAIYKAMVADIKELAKAEDDLRKGRGQGKVDSVSNVRKQELSKQALEWQKNTENATAEDGMRYWETLMQIEYLKPVLQKRQDMFQKAQQEMAESAKRNEAQIKAANRRLADSLIDVEASRRSVVGGARAGEHYKLSKTGFGDAGATLLQMREATSAYNKALAEFRVKETAAGWDLIDVEAKLTAEKEKQTVAQRRGLLVSEAALKHGEAMREALKEMLPMMVGEADALRITERLKNGNNARLAEEAVAMRAAKANYADYRSSIEAANTAVYGEIEALRRKLEFDKLGSASMRDQIVRRAELVATIRAEVDAYNELKTALIGNAAAKDAADAKRGVGGDAKAMRELTRVIAMTQHAQYTQLLDDMAVLERYKEYMDPATYERTANAHRNALLQMKADAGSMWAQIGQIVQGCTANMTDALTAWTYSIDKTRSKWVQLRDAVRSAVAGILIDVEKMLMTKLVTQPLMDKIGQAIGGVLKPVKSPEDAVGGIAGAKAIAQLELFNAAIIADTAALAQLNIGANILADFSLPALGTAVSALTTEMAAALIKLQAGSLMGAGKAFGGPVRAGVAYPVGEVGEELFVPDQNGTIVSTGQLSRMGGGGSVDNSQVHLHFHGNGTETQQGQGSQGQMNLARTLAPIVRQIIVQERRKGNTLNPIMG